MEGMVRCRGARARGCSFQESPQHHFTSIGSTLINILKNLDTCQGPCPRATARAELVRVRWTASQWWHRRREPDRGAHRREAVEVRRPRSLARSRSSRSAPSSGSSRTRRRTSPRASCRATRSPFAVLEASGAFPSGEVTPAIVVFRNPDGLDGEAREAIAERRRSEFAQTEIPGARDTSPPVVLRGRHGSARHRPDRRRRRRRRPDRRRRRDPRAGRRAASRTASTPT